MGNYSRLSNSKLLEKGDPVFSKEGLGLAVLNSFSVRARNINFVS